MCFASILVISGVFPIFFSCVKNFLTRAVVPDVSRLDASLTLRLSSVCAQDSLDMSRIDGILES